MYKKTDCKFSALQLEFEKKSVHIQLLEAKLSELEFEKVGVEEQCRLLRKRNEELEEEIKKIGNDKIVGSNKKKGKGHMVDLFGDEEDEVLQLMIENKVLECEKKKAEGEVEGWKIKFMKLQSRVDELEKSFASERKKSGSGGVKEIDQRLNEIRETNEKGNGIQGVFSSANLPVENMESKEDGCASVGVGNCFSFMDKVTKDVEEAASEGTPLVRTPLKESTYSERRKRSTLLKNEIQDNCRVRKRLAFPQDESPTKKMAPSTPVAGAVDVIDIYDSDDEKKATMDNSAPPTILIGKSGQQSSHFGQDVLYKESKLSCSCGMISTGQCSNDFCEGNLSFKPTFRRKFSCNVVTSDAESDDDDVPLSRLLNNRDKEKEPLDHIGKYGTGSFDSGDEVGESSENPCLRRLRKGKERKYPENDSPVSKNCTGRSYITRIPTAVIVTDSDDEHDDSYHSDRDSLDGFIVNDSNLSESEETSDSVEATQRDNSSSSENLRHSEDVSDGKLDYKEIISRIQRSGNRKAKWEFEADMLSDFGKNAELCMKAVCALYRQQTSAERIAKGTFVVNGRGFNQCDALRGSKLAEFLTNGEGDLHKSVDELIKHDPKGPEKCRELACRYSKQLYEIYVNQEDPFFLPSRGQT